MKIAILTVCCSVLTLSASARALAQQPAASETPARTAVAADGTAAEPVLEWKEDAGRRLRELAEQMSPEEYQNALVSTGMAEALASGRAGALPDTPGAKSGVGSWTPKGPFGIVGSGAYGKNGRISNLQIHLNGGSPLIFAGACQGGLWRASLATVGNWTSIGDSLPNPSVRGFAVNPANANHILVGTGDYGRWKGAGLFETTNGGGNWTQVNLGITPDHFFRILFHPNGSILAATSGGLLRKPSPTSAWQLLYSGNWTDLVIDPSDSTKLYATKIATGVYRSTSSGQFWNLISDPGLPPAFSFGRSSLAICRDAPANLALLVELGNGLQGIYKSINGGTNWTNITGNVFLYGSFATNQLFHAQAIAFRPNSPNEIYAAGVNMVVSYNGGAFWQLGESFHDIWIGHADVTQLYFSSITGDNTLWITNDGGIYKVDLPSKVTTQVIGGAAGLAVSEIDFFAADRDHMVAGLQDNGVFRSVNAGSTWTDDGGGDGGDVEISAPLVGGYQFATGPWSGPITWRLYRRQSSVSPVEDYPLQPNSGAQPTFYDPFGKRLYSIGATQILSIADSSPTTAAWTLEVSSVPGQQASYSFGRLFGSRANGRTLGVSYEGKFEDNGRDVTLFERQGNSWVTHHSEDLLPDDPANSYRVRLLVHSSEWPGECWVGGITAVGVSKLFHTTNYGATWQDRTGNLTSVKVIRAIALTPFDPLTVYVGTDIGVFRSTDGGQSWQPFQEGLPIVPASHLEFVVDDSHSGVHRLVLGTDGRGVYTRDIVAPPIIYVDKTATGGQNGTFELPYHSVTTAVALAPAGSIIALRAETYSEPIVTSKNVRIVTWAGTSVLK